MTESAFPVAAKLSPLIARLASDSEPEALACVAPSAACSMPAGST